MTLGLALVAALAVFGADTTLTGGTGRFEGASGSSRIRGVVDGGVARLSEKGTITY